MACHTVDRRIGSGLGASLFPSGDAALGMFVGLVRLGELCDHFNPFLLGDISWARVLDSVWWSLALVVASSVASLLVWGCLTKEGGTSIRRLLDGRLRHDLLGQS